MNYDCLCEAIRLCGACSLGGQGRGVPGSFVGPPPYDTFILGEAPGSVEMAKGEPFVGGSGQLLRSLLQEVGLTSYYLSNVTKHRPPVVKGKQQAPDGLSVEACAPFLRAEFELVKPTKLILLGKTAAKLVCEGNFAMKDVVNQTFEYDDGLRINLGGVTTRYTGIPTLCLYHPSYFLRSRTAPWIQKAVREWKGALRLFLGDRAPTYRIERVRCEVHG